MCYQLSVISCQLSDFGTLVRQQLTDNWSQEPRTKNKDCVVLIEIFRFFQTSDLRPHTLENRAKNQDCVVLIAIFCFFQTSVLIPPTSYLRQQSQEQRAKNKDCTVLIEIFRFFQTSTKVISCQLSVVRLGTLASQQSIGNRQLEPKLSDCVR